MKHEALDIVLYTEGLPFTGDTLERQSLGGSETAFIYVARELAKLGHQVTAYCLCTNEGTYDGVDYRHLSRMGEPEQRECDVFICSRFFLVFAGNIRAKIRFLWLHDLLMEQLNDHLTFLSPKIDLVYGLSEYHCRHIKQSMPELAPKVRQLMNGLDPALVSEATRAVTSKKHKMMFTSRPERGLLQALDLYEQLQDASLEFLICSYAYPQGDAVTTIEARCRQRIVELIERGFPISTGSFTKSDLYRHIAESKVVIYPAPVQGEIFCISAIEAQACGTIFLTVDDFAFRETVGYERVAHGDTTAFYVQLKALLSNESLRQELESKGREHVKSYTWQNVAQHLIEDATRQLQLHATSEIPPRRIFKRGLQQLPLYSAPLASALQSALKPTAKSAGL
jgi:glycosyltransferase involved in cell wall biosynthesis